MFKFFAYVDSENEVKEGEACCYLHALEFVRTFPGVVWWEIFDPRGRMVDSADKRIEVLREAFKPKNRISKYFE